MPVNAIYLQSFSRFMKEPLLLRQQEDTEEAIGGALTRIMMGRLGNNPTLTYVLNAKSYAPFCGEKAVSGMMRESSVYDGLIELADDSTGVVVTPQEMARVLALEDQMQGVIDLYAHSESYVSYFDIVLVSRSELYRYLLNRNVFLYLASSEVLPRDLCAIVPVVNVIRSLLIRGDAGYQTGLAHAGCFIGQVHGFLVDYGLRVQITFSDLFERALGINDSHLFSAPLSIILNDG